MSGGGDKSHVIPFSRRNGAAREGGQRPSFLATFRDRLRPVVSHALAEQDVASLTNEDLLQRVSHVVNAHLQQRQHGLNLVDQRNLIADLTEWARNGGTTATAEDKPNGNLNLSIDPDLEAARNAEPTYRTGQSNGAAPGDPFDNTARSKRKSKGMPTMSPARIRAAEAKEKIEDIVFERMDISAASRLKRSELVEQLAEIVVEVLAERSVRLNQQEQRELVDLLLDDMLGLGPLEPLLADETVNDILVNGAHQVYVERAGRLELTDVNFRDNNHVMHIAGRIVSAIGRRVDETSPLVDARLMDGSRVNIIIPPLAIDGPSISIRKFSRKSITLDTMARQANISPSMAVVLKTAARSRLNILISGGTGSGKTTMLNALSQLIDPDERIVTIEDAAELQLQQPHTVRLETRPANLEGTGEISMRDLVKNSLRMRPDRIILGEVRGSEAVDMLQAMNTGHEGSLGTIHANRPREALTRLENMVGMAGINLPAKAVRTQIAAAIDMIVQISRMRDGVRRVTNVTEVVGMEGDIITTQDLFAFEFQGEDSDGKILGEFKSSGLRPYFTPKAAYFGLEKPLLEAI